MELLPIGQAGAVIDQDSRTNTSAHVLMIPYPSPPHILPMLDLARQLASRGDIAVTFVSFQVFIDRLLKEESKRESSPSNAIHFVGVPDDLLGFNPPSELFKKPIVLLESLQLGHNLEPFVQRMLHDRESLGIQGPTCLVVDFMHWWSTDIASKLSIPRYVLVVASSTFLLALLSWHANGVDESSGTGAFIQLPGFPLSLIRSGVEFVLSTKANAVKGEQIRSRWPKSILESNGVLLNTCLAVDSQTVDSMRIMLREGMPLMSVGPLGMAPAKTSTQVSANVSMEGLPLLDESQVMNWLDQQPPSSVIYVCFGTTGLNNLGKQHVMELATGLEASQQRFVWVLRAPPDVQDVAEILPGGFEDRVKGRGFLHTGWAPQKKILAHPSTGGFLSSCGWNSTLESLMLGVPIIGWPSFADQPINCRYMAVVAKVAIELPQQAGHFVEANAMKKAIAIVLQSEEGTAMRERAGKYKNDIAKALAPGGSSRRAVQEFADLIRHRPASVMNRVKPRLCHNHMH